ncbi:MAG: type II secretion system F family protein [Chloroflexota bacterium]
MIIIGLGIFMVYYSVGLVSNDDLTLRVQEVVKFAEQEDSLTITSIETRDMGGSIYRRVFVPAFRRIGDFIGRFTPATSIDKINRDLAIAGYPMRIGAREFYGIRVILMAVGAILIIWLWLLSPGFDKNLVLASILILVMMLLVPIYWLRNLVTKRQDAIRKGMPDALDMLSVCATAGLGFDQALQRVSDEWHTQISEEFGKMLSEMELGISRQEALRSMERKLGISELSSFISVILQSEQLGMSIAETLQAQAEQMRIDRRFKAQEIAQKMPAKMLFPLAFLILPAILAVLLGPSVPVFIDLFFNVLR